MRSLVFSLCFVFFPLVRNQTTHQDQKWGKGDSYLYRIEAKFQKDPLKGFEGRDILPQSPVRRISSRGPRHAVELWRRAVSHWVRVPNF